LLRIVIAAAAVLALSGCMAAAQTHPSREEAEEQFLLGLWQDTADPGYRVNIEPTCSGTGARTGRSRS
jgi:hypothetical protein